MASYIEHALNIAASRPQVLGTIQFLFSSHFHKRYAAYLTGREGHRKRLKAIELAVNT